MTALLFDDTQHHYSPRAWWKAWVATWKAIGKAAGHRLELIERHNLKPISGDLPPVIDARIAGGDLANITVLAAPPDWVPVSWIPKRRMECKDLPRPCVCVECKYNLSMLPGPDRPGTRRDTHRLPESLIVYRGTRNNCALDEVENSPDGLIDDDIGEVMGVTGERARQIGHRAALKWEAAMFLKGAIEELRTKMPPGTWIDHVQPSNETASPNQHFVTVIVGVDAKQDKRERKAFSGVMVRKAKNRRQA